MSHDRISPTPCEPARCPACDAPIRTTLRGGCSACGHSFDAAGTFSVPVLRRRSFEKGPGRYENPFAICVGIACLLPIPFFAYDAPLLLIPLGILLGPVLLRTLRIASLPAAHGARSLVVYLIGAFVASTGIVALAGTAFIVAFGCIFLVIPGGNSISSPTRVYVWSLIPAFAVFLVVYLLFWPRVRSRESIHRPPDPEN
jgi:hypothetical protein